MALEAGGILATWTIAHYICIACTIIVVCLRLYCRTFMVKSVGADDVLILVSMVFFILAAIVTPLWMNHVWRWMELSMTDTGEVREEDMTEYNNEWLAYHRLGLIKTPALVTTLCITKCSILTFYLRLGAGTIKKPARIGIIALIAFIGVMPIWFILVQFLSYRPIRAVWYSLDYEEYTTNPSPQTLLRMLCVMQLIFDVAIFIIPLRTLIKLRLPRYQKVGVCFIYALGLLQIAATLISLQMAFVEWSASSNKSPMSSFADAAWTNVWRMVEPSTAIIVASLPAIAPLFRISISKLRSTYESSLRKSRSSGSSNSLIPGFLRAHLGSSRSGAHEHSSSSTSQAPRHLHEWTDPEDGKPQSSKRSVDNYADGSMTQEEFVKVMV